MTIGLWNESLLVLIIKLYWKKKDVQESTPKIQMLMFGLDQTSHFGLSDIIPLRVPNSFSHIICKILKYENTLTCKKISLDSGEGGMMF